MDRVPDIGSPAEFDAAAYQELLDRLDRAEAIVGINRGLVSMRRGEGKPAREVFDELRKQLGVRV
jgi:hypothetical protein